MKKNIVSIMTIGLAALATASCSHIGNKPDQARLAAERHPISVDQQTVTMTIPVDATLSEMSHVDKSRLRAFLSTYTARGHGPVTVTAPSGSGARDIVGQELASDIRKELYALGLDWAQIAGATYRVSSATNDMDVVVSFSNYVASPSACGDWKGEVSNRFFNRPSNNFGCASQNNLAAMIADPRDLISPQETTPADARRRDTVIDNYQQGNATSSAPEAESEEASGL